MKLILLGIFVLFWLHPISAQTKLSFLSESAAILDFDFNLKGNGVFVTNQLTVYSYKVGDTRLIKNVQANELLKSNYSAILSADVEFINDTVVFVRGKAIGNEGYFLNLSLISYNSGHTWKFLGSYNAVNLTCINGKMNAFNFDVTNGRSTYYSSMPKGVSLDYNRIADKKVYAYAIDAKNPVAYLLNYNGDLFSYQNGGKKEFIMNLQTIEDTLYSESSGEVPPSNLMAVDNGMIYFTAQNRMYQVDLLTKTTHVMNNGCVSFDMESNGSQGIQLLDGTVWIHRLSGNSNHNLHLHYHDIFTMVGDDYAIVRSNTLLEIYRNDSLVSELNITEDGLKSKSIQELNDFKVFKSAQYLSCENVLFEAADELYKPVKIFSGVITGLRTISKDEIIVSVLNEPCRFIRSTNSVERVGSSFMQVIDWNKLNRLEIYSHGCFYEKGYEFSYNRNQGSNYLIQQDNNAFPDSVSISDLGKQFPVFSVRTGCNVEIPIQQNRKVGSCLDDLGSMRHSTSREVIYHVLDSLGHISTIIDASALVYQPKHWPGSDFKLIFFFDGGDELRIYNEKEFESDENGPFIISLNGVCTESCDFGFLRQYNMFILPHTSSRFENENLVFKLGMYEYLHTMNW